MSAEPTSDGGLSPRVIVQVCIGMALVAILVAVGSGVFSDQAVRPAQAARPAATASAKPVVEKLPSPMRTPVPVVDEALKEAPVEVQIEPAAYEFGFLRPEEAVTRVVRLTNLDGRPIRLNGVVRGCSCTKVQVDPQVLQPGASIDVPATLTAGLTPTSKDSSVKVEVVGRPPIVLPTKGEIIRGVRARPRDIDTYRYRGTPENYIPRGRIALDAPEGGAFRVLSVNGVERDEPAAERHIINWSVSAYDHTTGLDADGQLIPAFWLVETDHPETPAMEIPVRHRAIRLEPRGERPWFFVEQRVNVGGIPSGGAGVFTLPVKWMKGTAGAGDTLVGARSESESFDIELVSEAPSGRESKVEFRVTPRPGTEGPFFGKVIIEGASYEAPLYVIGHAERTDTP